MQPNHANPPHWDLSEVYSSLDSPRLAQDIHAVEELIVNLNESIRNLPQDVTQSSPSSLSAQVASVIVEINNLLRTGGTIRAYIYSFVSTDSFNQPAMRMMSQFEQISVNGQKAMVAFAAWVGKLGDSLPDVIAVDPINQAHAFFLNETRRQSQYLMNPGLEDLAADLSLSGANAWSKLQGTLTSQLSVDFELDGKVETLPMPALINLHAHPDEDVRRRAYELEIQTWESVKEPLAAAINGIKGSVNILNKRRGRQDSLHSAIDSARIDRPTLEAMLSAMQASFPDFHRYFAVKARRLGKEKLAWWDIFAPVGKSERTFSFADAQDFILHNFSGFSPDLEAFARRAFDHRWIDAEQRKGKRGGAFCMDIPAVSESRILCNFDGTLDQVSTIAHELGHAYHNECACRAGKTDLQKDTPMTMAETASIMCETIIVEAALRQASSKDEELGILETGLIGDTQVIVDIYSRYLFEKEVFERRVEAELSPEDLCEIMERAQKATYGSGLDERYLHKYMWTWKPHYYSAELSFYNFPYAFGLLFGIGLYAIYQQRGSAFVPDYQNLLASTGEAPCADLAARFGIDIRSRKFWEDSLAVITRRIDRYTQL